MSTIHRTTTGRIRTVAVIDVGTTSIRMAIAEISGEGEVRLLESLSQGVALGKDTFTNGEIARSTMEECVATLKDYRRKLDEYSIVRPEDIRVIATSAVREALNRMTFVDRIFVATGLFVETLDAAELHRVTYRGVQPLLRATPELFESQAFVVEVGGGSTEMLLLNQGNVSHSQAFRLGSLRMQQTLAAYNVPRERMRRVMLTEIRSHLEPLTELIQPDVPAIMVAMGGDIRFAASQISKEQVSDEKLTQISRSDLSEFTDFLFTKREETLVSRYQLSFPEAETIAPALLINLTLAELLGVETVLISNVNLRDGLIRDLADGGNWSAEFQSQIIRSAWKLAEKYHVDKDHAACVADLCRQLFRQLQAEHELDERFETFLYVAALLHEIGTFISESSVHKHSMYLIMNSSLFGLTSDDLNLVALVARYHRRALPKPSHQTYAALDRYRRVAVSKLAAILRIAIALDASRTQRVKEITCTRNRNRLVISVPVIDDLSVEQISLRRNRQFFESIFGLQTLLRTRIRETKSEPSAQL
ncbi:Exopolyphosphatase [Thalassoglobus neptunius]|uniref:Exopolyphosphatase n=1 Tax=Thalassoglobus neptunius TaxID=1938619 RepID=A0A5C5X3A3_9PLAN|nr:Ppx/GppA phosphatase family protein [Thalassoglobus neptunius]TWT56662.1 Exopolyphosphatase [Thalassoglobus neptunius]